MQKRLKKNQKFNDWQLTKKLGRGGNGEVWEATNDKKEIVAIKFLKKIKEKDYSRFIDEILILERHSEVKGIMPLLDKFLPENLESDIPYYIMPIAQPLTSWLKSMTLKGKIKVFLKIIKTLKNLHELGISHRDLKPANILVIDNQPVIADFGLVHYPKKKNITPRNENVGPKWTMAPEMRRIASSSDGLKADVYSIAKTLWILISEENKGFDGQYSSNSILSISKYYPEEYLLPIENILTICTDNDPEERPDCFELIILLEEWLMLEDNTIDKSLHQWISLQKTLFTNSIPKSCSWEKISDIILVLNLICMYKNLNHAFFPNGGGLDLYHVKQANEKGCIELNFSGIIEIIKPKTLYYESFSKSPEWNYFRLEIDKLKPAYIEANDYADKSEDSTSEYEEISELMPGRYFPFNILENKNFYRDSYPINKFSRHVVRWFKGNFVFFCKSSPYNRASSTYDGRHNNMDALAFRRYIDECVDLYTKEVNDIEVLTEEEEKEKIRKKSIEDNQNRVFKEEVFVCYGCGQFVYEKGDLLNKEDLVRINKIVDDYGHETISQTYGNCCFKDGWYR
ncbi:protein kinase [uncultured Psychroserpens sp.]|uniref:protein kinase domain-containing protein n=1 Tax=uncultured Psychroserpens sp. TaxID=255436 RepID=UPI00261B6196|nr:protein kinase [uncultured Psychroserpens sp.]